MNQIEIKRWKTNHKYLKINLKNKKEKRKRVREREWEKKISWVISLVILLKNVIQSNNFCSSSSENNVMVPKLFRLMAFISFLNH